mgnify:CR=1 FL=1
MKPSVASASSSRRFNMAVITVVFPVPGGPWISAISGVLRAISIADADDVSDENNNAVQNWINNILVDLNRKHQKVLENIFSFGIICTSKFFLIFLNSEKS